MGFAFLEENGVRFGFVDVPGHERFISNMLAGAAGIDVLLLVIAADESIKPQTREHFDICRLLGVKRGVVALTKSDLVDSDTLGLVRMEAEEFLRGSFLENAPIVPVSAKTGAGLTDLKKALNDAAANASAKDAARYFRLPIDRAFAMKGFGSVVTGTLISGSVGAGDEVELFPRGERLRVRGVQSGGKTVERATPGQRTAVNLAGIEHTALKRGMVLATPGKFRKTRRIDVRLELLPSAKKMKQGARVHFHAGTVETIAEVFFHGVKELSPGGSAFANLKLQDEVLVLAGDRFIVRQFSPVVTIGGGAVLDPLARRPMLRDTGRVKFLETLERGSHEEILEAMTERALLGLGSRRDRGANRMDGEGNPGCRREIDEDRACENRFERTAGAGLRKSYLKKCARKSATKSRNFRKKTHCCLESRGRICAPAWESAYGAKHSAPRWKNWPRRKSSTRRATW